MSFALDHLLISLPAALTAFVLVHKFIGAITCSIRHLPGPGGAHWFWGHELIIHESPNGEAHSAWISTYGSTYKIKGAMFHPDILVTVDPGVLSHMFGKEVYSYPKSPITRPILARMVGKGLLWAEGSAHKLQRAQLSRFFTTQAIKDRFDTIQSCANTASERLATHIAEKGSGTKINALEWTARATLDVIGRFAFDYDFGSGESRAARAIQRSWKKQVDLAFQRAGLLGLVIIRAFPFIVNLPVKSIQAQGEVKVTVREIARSIINQGADEGKEKDMLRTLIELSENGELNAPEEELLDHVTTLVVAGNETTSGSLSFAMYELARHPEYQTRLREEIAALGREPTYEDLTSGMPWLDAVMKEIFRFRPIALHMERVALKDDVLRLRTPVYNEHGHKVTEVPIKAGQVIHIPTISMSQMKSVWGEDADEFRPERWLDPARLPPPNQTSSGWNGLFIFAEGTRNCIGFRLAILEFKTILSTFIRNFEFHDTGATVHARFAITLQPYVVGEEEQGSHLPLRVTIAGQ